MAKMCLRGVNFSCSLIVLSMISATFTIFNASKNLPDRGSATPWAKNQQTWPQITLLCIAAVSLAMSIGILYAYWRGGHRRAEKAAVYYTVFAIGFFIFSIVIWSIGAAILSQSHNNGHDKDMWGWACKEGKRKELYEDQVDYGVVCRMQVSKYKLSNQIERSHSQESSTGHSFAHSSRSLSKSSQSPSTASFSIASIPNGDSTSPWICATRLDPIYTWPSCARSPHRTPLASRRPPCRLLSHHTFTMTTSTTRRTGTEHSTRRSTSRSPNPNRLTCSHHPSGSRTQHRRCHRTGLYPPRSRRSTFQRHQGSKHTKRFRSQALTLARL